MHPAYIWLIVTVILLIGEVLTPGAFFMASLAAGTLVAGLVAFVCPLVSVQLLTFCVVAPVTVVMCRRLLAKMDKTPTIPMNVDALIGRTARVIRPIGATGDPGCVRIDAQEWRAVSDRDIEEGEEVEIREVRGTRLYVA